MRLIACMLLATSALMAQTTYSVLRGTATDSSGAVMPGVAITATDIATNLSVRTVSTDNNGNYEIPDLKPGTYRVKAEAAGFRVFVADNVLLDVGSTRRLDVILQVGATTETVTVEAGASLITNESGTIGGEVDRRKFTDQPAVDVYPSPLSMLTTVPGIQGNGWNLVMSGISDRNKQTWAMDGVANDTTGDQNDNPAFFETVQVTTVIPGADSARAVNFNMVSNAGLTSFTARPSIAISTQPSTAGVLRPQESALHPARVGWRGERAHLEEPHLFLLLVVPPVDSARVFHPAECADSQDEAGRFQPVPAEQDHQDPVTGLPFQGNIIPSNRINGVSKTVQDLYYPTPNLGGPDTLTNNFNWIFPYNSDLYKGDWPFVRVDHNLTHNNTIYFRWSSARLLTSGRAAHQS